MFRFASPWLLALAPLAPLVGWWLARRRTMRDPRLPIPEIGRLGLSIRSPWERADRAIPWMRACALLLALLALARPQWGRQEDVVTSSGIDVVVALDISGSMRCQDSPPRGRLEVARESLTRFVRGRPGDRIGLVVFGSSATTRCPPTLDHALLERFVEETDFAPPGEDTTALGLGLAAAGNRLRSSPAKSRVVVLVTDGRNNAGPIAPEEAAEAVKALGLKVYTVGVGSEGEALCPVDTPAGRRLIPQEVDLDEPLLRRIAEGSGGRYFRAVDAEGFEEAMRSIDALEKTEIESRVRTVYAERFHVPLVPAAILLAVEVLLTATRLRRIP